VAQRVIHVLEVIEIQQQDRAGRIRPGTRHRQIELVVECRPVGQPGQVVMAEHVPHLTERPAHRLGIDRAVQKIIGKDLVGVAEQIGRAAHFHIHDKEQLARRHQQQGQHQALDIAMGNLRAAQIKQDGDRKIEAEHPPFERHLERRQPLAGRVHRRHAVR